MGPVVLYAKCLMQDIWRHGLHWDESVPQIIYSKWLEFSTQLKIMKQITFDRKIFLNDYNDVQLHGFCDASSVGYGACLYMRTPGINDRVNSELICAKSRVAPLKPITIPRLKLCGALLLTRLYQEITDITRIKSNRIIFWCDSTIVLQWLKTPPHLLKTYIANRVAEVQEIANSVEWRHIRSEDNPADAISKGQLPNDFVKNQLWSCGPSWLAKRENKWPNECPSVEQIPELKKNACFLTTSIDRDIIKKYSSYNKTCKIITYCCRWKKDNKHTGQLSVEEIYKAEIRVLKIVQATEFAKEIRPVK
ncbi:uncharacterized protein [Cardiocondyla obscurior]|uniref:uncharacterized protein n=1 Tax=Cardiocondyla obscurior TaxID=286306 RepID=UPI0039657370